MLPSGNPPPSQNKSSIHNTPKISLDNLESLQSPEFARYSFKESIFTYDFLFIPQSQSNAPTQNNKPRLLVSMPSRHYKPYKPNFFRWSWHSGFPGHYLCLADPITMLLEHTKVTWCTGYDDYEVLPTFCKIVKHIAKIMNVEQNSIIILGSSAGGFASLKLSLLLPGCVCAPINAQTDVRAFSYKGYEQDLLGCYPGLTMDEIMDKYGNRLTLYDDIDKLKNTKILYVQNIQDEYHVTTQLIPLLEEMGYSLEHELSKSKDKFVPVNGVLMRIISVITTNIDNGVNNDVINGVINDASKNFKILLLNHPSGHNFDGSFKLFPRMMEEAIYMCDG